LAVHDVHEVSLRFGDGVLRRLELGAASASGRVSGTF
jgi:hypothetical protein